MVERSSPSSALRPVRIDLQPYLADIQFSTLTVGVDNIHFDVFLSPRFADFARKYVADLIRQTAKLEAFYGFDAKPARPPETGTFRKLLTELLQASLTNAQYQNNCELDLLFRVAVLKFLTSEISNQFSTLILECKERLRARGTLFERSEQAHVLNARLAEVQADRRNIIRQVGQQIYQMLVELEDNTLARVRKAFFGDEFLGTYDLLKSRILFAEGGKDDHLFMEHYVLLGSFVRDHDRFETIDALLLEFLGDYVLAGEQGEEIRNAYKAYDQLADKGLASGAELARLEEERDALQRKLEGGGDFLSRLGKRKDPAELRAGLADVGKRHSHLRQKMEELGPQIEEEKRKADTLTETYHTRLGDFLNQPENARRLFDPQWPGGKGEETAETRERLLEEWVQRLEHRDLLLHILASYELRNIYLDYCPPVHLQQLKKALVNREELKRVEGILKQFPARRFSPHKIEEAARNLQRYTREEVRKVAMRFAEDFMRLRRDLRNAQHINALMERVNLVRIEKTRELSRMNNSLYECVLAEEVRPAEDRVVAHVIIKADVRGSTKITQDLLARGMNPASHFSLNLHEPVKRILERFGAAKVFLEGDAIILAIYETEANRPHQRAVARACVLAHQIVSVSQAYNARVEASDLPRLELGVGVAYQDSPPAYWTDGDSRLMISRALNLSDRLSGCAKAARRLLKGNESPFSLFLFQTVADVAEEEEVEEFTIRYNLNGIELNEEGFAKLGREVALTPVELSSPLPWGIEKVTFFTGQVLIGETLDRIVLRKGVVRQLLSGNQIGPQGTHAYYEICVNPKVIQMVEAQLAAAPRKN